jgi:hypothetical protein
MPKDDLSHVLCAHVLGNGLRYFISLKFDHVGPEVLSKFNTGPRPDADRTLRRKVLA